MTDDDKIIRKALLDLIREQSRKFSELEDARDADSKDRINLLKVICRLDHSHEHLRATFEECGLDKEDIADIMDFMESQ